MSRPTILYWFLTAAGQGTPNDIAAARQSGPLEAEASAANPEDLGAIRRTLLRGAGDRLLCYEGVLAPDSPEDALLFIPTRLIWDRTRSAVLRTLDGERAAPGGSGPRSWYLLIPLVILVGGALGALYWYQSAPQNASQARAPLVQNPLSTLEPKGARLAGVSGLTVAEVSDTTAGLRWEPVPDAVGYVVKWGIIGGAPAQQLEVATTEIQLTHLVPNSPYEVSVSAYNKAGSSPSVSQRIRTYRSWDEIRTEVAESVVTVSGKSSWVLWSKTEETAGFFVAPDRVITSLSFLRTYEHSLEVAVMREGKPVSLSLKLLEKDEAHDVALLALPLSAKSTPPPIALAQDEIATGKPVGTLNPGARRMIVGEAVVSGEAEQIRFRVSGQTMPRIGTPLMDGYGLVVGVVVKVEDDFALAAPLSSVKTLVAEDAAK